ncbi:hypothetical protein D910_12061 [Dendroctonus ponderosae]|uniref:Rho-GAP domain-containing protein n=1 Tax=Dendroctonus ponderosae TaxID=77166 RepID=U4UNU8_DENPD|nr:hypothetical protein D910_12061 [Dendroctonus ponderosae]
MDFDSPEVMKDFPGLYMSERRKGNDNNDESEKASKKDMIIGKRKEKKDKKDKDKGYAALEGESSDESSPCKAKKSKAFKFTKSKDKDKDKECPKDKGECSSKVRQKKKVKLGFGHMFNSDGENQDIAEALPIFGADLKDACQRGKCHDGVNIPLPVRECIDFIEIFGLNFENVYKVSGNKNKVNQIKKMYNNRQTVKLSDYDVPTVTSVLKTFLRDLPEPIFTNELLVRFEEAAAIFNYNTREKYLKGLLNGLSSENKELIMWLIMHFYNIVQRDQVNRMNKQNLAQALNHTLHISSKLLQALITHRMDFYPTMHIKKYYPPLDAGSTYPEDPNIIRRELEKLESALNLIHWEMQQGFSSKWRQDQLWEVQRVQTDLKRKLKKELSHSSQTVVPDETEEQPVSLPEAEEVKGECYKSEAGAAQVDVDTNGESEDEAPDENIHALSQPQNIQSDMDTDGDENTTESSSIAITFSNDLDKKQLEDIDYGPGRKPIELSTHHSVQDNSKLTILHYKNALLMDLVDNLSKSIQIEYDQIQEYKKKLDALPPSKGVKFIRLPHSFRHVRELLACENRILEIKKVELVREIMDLTEECMDMSTTLMAAADINESCMHICLLYNIVIVIVPFITPPPTHVIV